MRVSSFFTIAAFALLASTVGSSSLWAASNPCKGLAETACTANAACSWVKASKTKKGKEVAAYCRKNPASKAKGPAKKAGQS